jgi:hypothetical protein
MRRGHRDRFIDPSVSWIRKGFRLPQEVIPVPSRPQKGSEGNRRTTSWIVPSSW